MASEIQPPPVNREQTQFEVSTGQRGARIETLHTDRKVKIWGILETEIDLLINYGSEERLWSQIFGGSLALALGCIWSMMTQDAPISKYEPLFFAMFTFGAVVGFLKSHQYRRKQKNTIAVLAADRRRDFFEQVGELILNWLRKSINRKSSNELQEGPRQQETQSIRERAGGQTGEGK